MNQISQAIGLLVAGILAFGFAVLALRVATGNKTEYERNRRRAGNLMRTIRGEIPSAFDGTRDARVSAGLAIKNNVWIEQGRLSNDAVASALRRPQ